MKILSDLFGAGTWGTGGNMVAWVICGVFAGLWLHAKLKANHVAAAALARLHHKQATEQRDAQHKEHMDLLRKQHSQLSDQVAATRPVPAEPVTVIVNEPPAAHKRGERL